jgi:short-subunit dehydrogenase involved in D-alanine esterification of teichoic acids
MLLRIGCVRYPGIDVLVNNAGFAFKGDIFGADEALQTLSINLFG